MGGKRGGFARNRISRTETIISCLLLLLIVGIGVGIYVKGQIYDPGLFSLNPHAISRNRPAEVLPNLLVSSEESKSSAATDAGPAPSAAPVTPPPSDLLEGLAPAGWKAMGAVAQFTAANLFEKIDGRAEQYLDYNFVRLTCGSLVSEEDKNQFIDIYLFDMGKPAQAFGVFSVERAEGVPAVALGREGYRSAASYFFWKGRYYVQVLPSDKGTKLAQVGLEVARSLEKRLRDDGEPVWGLSALPEKDRIPGTAQYFLKDALSLDFLKETYIAQYRKGGAKVTAFLSKQPSAEAAVQTLTRYEAYLKNFGKGIDKKETQAYTMVTGDMGGTFDVVFRRGKLIGGITMVASQSIAEKSALELLAALRDKDS